MGEKETCREERKKERKKMRMSGRNGFQRSRTDKEKDSSRKYNKIS